MTKENFNEIENNLKRNIVYGYFQLEFHEKLSDEELMLYYNGAEVNRDLLIDDTIRIITENQKLLEFYLNNKEEIIQKYADYFRSFERTSQPNTLQTDGGESNVRIPEETGSREDNKGDIGPENTDNGAGEN